MKIISKAQRGSVLIIALLTITVLTLICATSLYVTSQNANAGMQTASWQQALTGAESGVDRAIRALNKDKAGGGGAWTGWSTQAYTTMPTQPPLGSPAPTPTAATAAPSPGYYNYYATSALSPTISLSGISGSTPEGNTAIWGWVTIDTANVGLVDSKGNQWYRIRATGVAGTNGLFRASSNKLDNDLRNTIGLRFNRKTNTAITDLGTSTPPQATRSIEVIMQPLTTSIWVRGITESGSISMSGGTTVVDSFDSTDFSKSNTTMVTFNGVTYTYGQYTAAKRQNHGDMATLDGNGSDLRGEYVYGNVAYSTTGSAIKNTTHVTSISTPGPPPIPPVYAPGGGQPFPTWTSNSTYTGGGSNPPNGGHFDADNATHAPVYIKVNGDLVVSSSGNPLRIKQHDTNPGTEQVYIWVTGKLTTQGSGYITQDPNVQVTWIVGGDITVNGSSYNNLDGQAANLTIYGYGPSGSKVTVSSGSANFVGAIDAPNYDTTISGGADYVGALISNTLTMSGGSSFHYDESLNKGVGSTGGSYAFASWFEDNSDTARGIIY